MSALDHVVFLKFGAYKTADLSINTIPLKVTSLSISTNKTIPSLEVPLSGALSGESITAALDLGMASKSVSLQGFITEQAINKKWSESDAPTGAKTYTPIEIAQMIHSSVDSTGIQTYQSINELVFLYDSKVGNDGNSRTAVSIPFTYASRGDDGKLDNYGTRDDLKSDFPTSSTSEGMKGFIRSFETTIDSETIDVSFSMQFEIAEVFPSGKIATKLADALS